MNQALSYAAVAFIADERKRAIETLKAERDKLVAALETLAVAEMGEPSLWAKAYELQVQSIARAALAKVKP